MLTKSEQRKLETARRKLLKCGGDCKHCQSCHIYTASSKRAIYMAVGCDTLPEEMFGAIADYPSQLHEEAIRTVEFELSLFNFRDKNKEVQI